MDFVKILLLFLIFEIECIFLVVWMVDSRYIFLIIILIILWEIVSRELV
jgi:NADH:ubiquinone oxidoreductase subunit 3 (subunit A)